MKADIEHFALPCLVVDRLNVSMLKETGFSVLFCAFCIFMRANSGFKDIVLGLARSLLEWRQDKQGNSNYLTYIYEIALVKIHGEEQALTAGSHFFNYFVSLRGGK